VPPSLAADVDAGAVAAATTDRSASIASALNATRLKNARGAIRAFSRVRRVIPTAQYHLVGPGLGADGSVAAWARSSALDAGIHFHGPVSHQRFLDLVAGSDVLLHPSRDESFGAPALEGMAMGKTVVVGRGCGACPWVIDEGRAGVLVNVHSPRDMAEQLIHVLQHPEAYAPQRAAARQLIERRYSPKAVSDAYQAMYERVHAQWQTDS
jgi:glycosyltransferase involved in cell wall biosynthesis